MDYVDGSRNLYRCREWESVELETKLKSSYPPLIEPYSICTMC